MAYYGLLLLFYSNVYHLFPPTRVKKIDTFIPIELQPPMHKSKQRGQLGTFLPKRHWPHAPSPPKDHSAEHRKGIQGPQQTLAATIVAVTVVVVVGGVVCITYARVAATIASAVVVIILCAHSVSCVALVSS